ncbi:MAG: hypothetical protein CFE26_17465 [Verrucomicrobiales bacterium VVV1]|nr:MAG: hypothetical protein CFE26_17465 [Verrucomicrobiales bacterium VVV1]
MSNRQQRFPTDLAAVLGLYWIMLPIAALGASIFPAILRARNEGDLTILWVVTALGTVGASLLFWARLPLYRERRFFSVGPRHLDARHRRIYWIAWTMIIPSISLLALILAAFG